MRRIAVAIVVLILGLLALRFYPYSSAIPESDRHVIEGLVLKIESFKNKHGHYPCNLDQAEIEKTSLPSSFRSYNSHIYGGYQIYLEDPNYTRNLYEGRDGKGRWSHCSPYGSCPNPGLPAQECLTQDDCNGMTAEARQEYQKYCMPKPG